MTTCSAAWIGIGLLTSEKLLHFNMDDSFKWCTSVCVLRAVLIRKSEWANNVKNLSTYIYSLFIKKISTAIQLTEMYILHMRAESWAYDINLVITMTG